MSDAAVPVAVTGFTWTAGLMALLNLLAGGALVTLLRTRPTLKKLANEREASLLEERAEEMAKMRERIEKLEAKAEADRARHEAERALDRHRINNMDQALTYLFMLFETQPDRAPEAITAVKEMRARQMEAEALEKAAIHAAAIKKAGEV